MKEHRPNSHAVHQPHLREWEKLLIETSFRKALVSSKNLYLAFTDLGREEALSNIPDNPVEADVLT